MRLQPLIVRNPHPRPMTVQIEPGQMSIALAPNAVLEIDILNLPDGAPIEISHDPRPGLLLRIPSTQFSVKSSRPKAAE